VLDARTRTRAELTALDSRIKGLDESGAAATVQREDERRERLDRALTHEEGSSWVFAAGLLLTVVGTFV
jgi:hypothetical protein